MEVVDCAALFNLITVFNLDLSITRLGKTTEHNSILFFRKKMPNSCLQTFTVDCSPKLACGISSAH